MNSPTGQRDPVSLETAERMLSFVRGVDDRDLWVKLAYVLKDEYGDAGFDAWNAWSMDGSSYNEKSTRDVWKSVKSGGSKRATIGTLIALAKEGGWTRSEKDRHHATPEEIAERKRAQAERLEAERIKTEAERADAAAHAADMWSKASEAGSHPYLTRKQIKGIGARILGDLLLVPVKQSAKALVGLQTISPNGDKKFIFGTPKKGGYCVLGKPGPVIAICEGFATGVSIHMATGYCVVVAFDAGNLRNVAEKMRGLLPGATFILAADDDAWTDGNPGVTSATDSARAIGAMLAIPRWYGDRADGHTDFNDLHADEGLNAVAECFQSAEDPEPRDKTVSAADQVPHAKPVSGVENSGNSRAGAYPSPPDAVVHQAPGPVILQAPGQDVLPLHLSRFDRGQPQGYAGHEDDLFIYTGTPMKTAQLFHATLPEGGRILFWRGEFYSWDGARYVVRDRIWIEQRVYHFMSECFSIKIDAKGNEEIVRFNPKTTSVNDAIHALRAVCYSAAEDVGTWLDPMSGDFPGSEIIAFQNCFLHWPTRTILPSTDRLLVTSALEFDYEPTAGTPVAWLKFLDSIWGGDPESSQALAEMFGYLLTDDTSQHKIFMLVGPPRSGKGTILRVLESLVGKTNRCSPSLSSLGGPFGLQSLLGKRMAMISDARLSGKADQHAIIENMLRISGDDAVDVNRKNLPSLDGVTLRARFVMATNELPAFTDASSALANRFVPFKFTTSFLGSEDHGLTNRLLSELSSILLWALDGLTSLRARGYFVTPASANEIADELLEQTSPVRTFVAEKCVIGDGNGCDRDDIFVAWKAWCTDQGRDHPGTKVSFGRQLSAAFPAVKRSQPRETGTRLNLYSGIRLRHDYDDAGGPL